MGRVACGSGHTLFLAGEGAFGCGDCSVGQLTQRGAQMMGARGAAITLPTKLALPFGVQVHALGFDAGM